MGKCRSFDDRKRYAGVLCRPPIMHHVGKPPDLYHPHIQAALLTLSKVAAITIYNFDHKNRNFEKPSRNSSKRTKVKILKKKNLYSSPKIWFRVCSVTSKMFEHRNSGENRVKRSEIFIENRPRAHKVLI